MRSLLLLTLLACATAAHAQQFDAIHYNTNNSQLPHDICYRLMQDHTGYLWIGTDDGLVRFDGRDMKLYNRATGCKYAIAPASYKENKLLATWKGGIHRIVNDSAIALKALSPNLKTSGNNLMLYKDIIILHNFDEYYLFHFDQKYNTISNLNLYYTNNKGLKTAVSNAAKFKFAVINDALIAYNHEGIFSLHDSSFSRIAANCCFDYIMQAPGGSIYGAMANTVYTISKDFKIFKAGYSFNKPQYHIEGKLEKFHFLPSGNIIIQMNEQNNTELTKNKTFYFVNFSTGKTINLIQSLGIKSRVADLLTDNEGSFWISTDGEGLYHVFEPRHIQTGNVSKVNSLFPDSSTGMYVGTQDGVYHLSGDTLSQIYKNYTVGRIFRNSSGKISAYCRNMSDNNLILSGKKAIADTFKYNYFYLPHYTASENGSIYLTDHINGKQFDHTLQPWPAPLRDACEDREGKLWLAGDYGLYYFNRPEGRTFLYSHPVLGTTAVNRLIQDGTGTWVASNSGLFYLAGDSVITYYNESRGLSNSRINDVLIDKKRIWIGTQNGLNILNRITGECIVIKKHDGLIANDVTALAVLPGSKIAAGSSKGLTIIDMTAEYAAAEAPRVILEEVSINEKRTGLLPLISAPYNSRLSISYNAITFIYPELLRFQYRLSAADKWIDTKNKSLMLSSLKPGSYKIQVRAKKYNSSWGEPLMLTVEIEYPWWESFAFYLFIFIAVAYLLYILLKSRERKLVKESALKQQFSELRLKALQTQLNPHFISNTLSAIQYFSLKQDDIASNEYLTRFANLTRLLLESSRKRFVLLKDELQTVDYYMGLEFLRFKDRFTYTITVSGSIDVNAELVPGMLLQPFIENSINHGIVYLDQSVKGHIEILIEKKQEALCISITDNGIGRQKAKDIQQQTGKAYRSRSSEIISEIRDTVNNLPGCYININTNDVPGEGTGTSVIIYCNINPMYREEL